MYRSRRNKPFRATERSGSLTSQQPPTGLTGTGRCYCQEQWSDFMISLRNLSTVFTARGKDPITAVDDVSLEVPRGSIQGMIGFSGAGKPNLLRNNNLFERPSHRRVLIDGTDLLQLSDDEQTWVG